MKKRKFSKVIAVALAALMVVGMVPMMAFADDGDPGLYQHNNQIDSEYYNTNIIYENGGDDDYGFINFEYTGVNKDGTVTADDVNGVNITMSDGDGWSETADSSSLGWAHNLIAESHYSDNASNRYAYVGVYGSGYYSLSQDDASKWSAVAVNEETGEEYPLTMEGFNTKSADTVTDKVGSSMATTISGDLPAGEYELTVSWYFQMKHYDYSYFLTPSIETSDYHSACGIEGTDVFDLTVKTSTATSEELDGGIKKITDGNSVSFTGGSDDVVKVDATVNLNDDPNSVGIAGASDKVNTSFDYEGFDEYKAISVSEIEEGTFSITNFTSDYSATVEVTEDMIADVIGNDLWTILGSTIKRFIDIPVYIESDSSSVKVEYKAIATNVNDENDSYEIPVTVDENNNATFSIKDIPVGTYSITIKYTLSYEFTFDYELRDLESLGYVISASGTVPTSENDVNRVITSSDDGFTLTVNPCTHPNGATHHDPVEATCADGNIEYWQCEDCGRYFLDENLTQEADYETNIVIPGDPNNHAWDEDAATDYKAPTCVVDGAYETKTCTVCENTYYVNDKDNLVLVVEDNYVIPALGHAYELTETVNPSCTEAGKNIYTCQRESCTKDTEGHTYTEDIKATGHTYDYDEDTVYNWAKDYSSCTAVTTCSVCGEVVETNECDIDVVETPATCTEDGSIVYTASFTKLFVIHHYSDPETVVVPATGHELTHVEAVEATAKEDGNVEYWYCEVCGCYFLDEDATIETTAYEVIIPALGEELGFEPEYEDPVETTETTDEGFTKTTNGNADAEDMDVVISGEDVELHVTLDTEIAGFQIYVEDLAGTDSLTVSYTYDSVHKDGESGTIYVGSGSNARFTLSGTYDGAVNVLIYESMIEDALGSFIWGMFSGAVPEGTFPYPIDSSYSMVTPVYSAVAIAEDGTEYPIDVTVIDGINASFSCAGLPDGEYTVVVDYDYTFGIHYSVLEEMLGNLISGDIENARTISGTDTFNLVVTAAIEGSGDDTEPTEQTEPTEPTESGTETGETETETETGEGEVETGEAEHEHSYYIVDSAEATCEDLGWVLYACSECGEQFTQYTEKLGHDYVDGVCTRCGALDPDYVVDDTPTAAAASSSTKATASDDDDDDEFTEVEDEDEFTEVEEDEFDVVSDESTTSPQTGASMAAIGAAMAFAAAGIVVVTRKKKEED